MANSKLVRKLKAAIREVEVRFRTPLVVDGVKCSASWDAGVCTIDPKECGSWDEMVLSLLHEGLHEMDEILKEMYVGEALDRVAFSSPALRWEASRRLGDAKFGFDKPRKADRP